ncbi:MAG: SDR family oxidoreductase [Opitutaceae bacterium]|jgi:NAD(P)-dependent dehydrogenase (short-subunit alcohol dehydrogenase family)|nr:SDR family oxidoreductase [Opitutaceae bacterium]
METLSLSGNAALVTGSSRGLGLGIGLGLIESGADVVFHGHDERPGGLPKNAPYLQSDLLDTNAPAQLLTDAFSAQPDLNLLVCNAGSIFDIPFLEMDLERWDRTQNLNVRATYFLVQAFARAMVERKRAGAIVITSSINGQQAEIDSSAYDTSKGALVMMTRTLAQALAAHDIRVNGIAPGIMRTPLTERWLNQDPAGAELYAKRTLLNRLGTPEDCAGAVSFLLSPAAGYITGQVLAVDGGMGISQIGNITP